MARVPLSDTDDWKLKFDEQDIRGHDVYDAGGTRVGEVDEMIVDTEARRVTMVRLDDGRELSARDITITDGAVYLSKEVPTDVADTVTVYDDFGHVVERERVGTDGSDAYDEDFKNHHATTFGTTGRAYTEYEPAYRYGYESAGMSTFGNRSYDDAETDLRGSYGERHPDRDFDADREAIRYGYGRARSGVR